MWKTGAKLKAHIKELKDELEELNNRFEEEVEKAVQEQVNDFISRYRRDAQRFGKVAESLGISPQAGGEIAVAKIRALQDEIEELSEALREAERLTSKYVF